MLSYDPSFGGVGRMAVAVGPIESARYVVVLVPGMGSAPENFHELVRSACNVRRACLKEIQVEDTGAGKVPVAVVAWQGYKAPRNLWAVKGEVSNEALAQAGSQLLNLDLAQWRALWRGDAAVRAGKGLPEQPVITVVGYSYGSVVAGHAMMKPVPGGTSVTAAARAAVTGAVKGAGAEAVGYSVVGPAAKSWQAGGGAAEIAVEAAKSAARVGTTAADIAAGGGVGTAMDAAKTIGARTLAAAHEAYYRQPVGGGNADYLVLLGSPGTGRRARHLNIPASHIYTGANKEDIVSKLNWFSIDPTHMKYGDVTRIRTEDEDFPVTGPVAPHTAYYTPGSESLRNIARIALGTPEKVTTKPQRSGFVLEGHRSLLGRLFTSPSDTPRPGQPPTTTRRVGTGYLKADTVNGAPALVRSNKSHPRYSGMRSSGADGIHHTLGGASFFTPDWMDITFHNGVPRITTASPLPEGYLSDLVCVTTISPGHTTTVSTEHFTDDPERDHTVYLPLDLTPHTLTVISPISNQHQNLWKTPGLLNIPDIIKTLVKNAVPALPDLTPLSIPGSADIFPLTGFAAPLLLTQQQLEAAEKVLRVLEPALVQAPSGTELAEPQETFINIRELVRIIEKATGKEKEGLVQGLMMGEGIGLARIIEKAAGTEKKEFTQRPAAGMETAPARPYQGERISLNGTSYLDLPDTVSLATEFSGKILQITGQPDTHDTTIEYNITLNWHHHGTYHLGTIPADGQPHTINLHAQTHATFYEIMQPTTGDIEVTPTIPPLSQATLPTYRQSHKISGRYPRYTTEFSTRLLRDYPLPIVRSTWKMPPDTKNTVPMLWRRSSVRQMYTLLWENGIHLDSPPGTDYRLDFLFPCESALPFREYEYVENRTARTDPNADTTYAAYVSITVPTAGDYTDGELWQYTAAGVESYVCTVPMGEQVRHFITGPYADPIAGFRFKAKIPTNAPQSIPLPGGKFLPVSRIPKSPETLGDKDKYETYVTSLTSPTLDPMFHSATPVPMARQRVVTASGRPISDPWGEPQEVFAPTSPKFVKWELQADMENIKVKVTGPYDIRVRTMNRVSKFPGQKPSSGTPTVENYPAKSTIIKAGSQKIVPRASTLYLEPLPGEDRFMALTPDFLTLEMVNELPSGALAPGTGESWRNLIQHGSGTRVSITGSKTKIIDTSGNMRTETSWFPTLEIIKGNSTVRCLSTCTLPYLDPLDPSHIITGCEPNGLFDEVRITIKTSGSTLLDAWLPANGLLYRFPLPGRIQEEIRQNAQIVTEAIIGREAERLQEQSATPVPPVTPAPAERVSILSGTTQVAITRSIAPKADLAGHFTGGSAGSAGSAFGAGVGMAIQLLDPQSDTTTNIETALHGGAVVLPFAVDKVAVALELGKPVLRKIAYLGPGVSLAANAYSLTQKLTAREQDKPGIALDVLGVAGDVLVIGMTAAGVGAAALLVTGALLAAPALLAVLDSLLHDALDHPYDFMKNMRDLCIKVINDRLEAAQHRIITPLQQKIMDTHKPGNERDEKLLELDRRWQAASQQIARQVIISQYGEYQKWIEGLNPGYLAKVRLSGYMTSLGYNPQESSYSDRQSKDIYLRIANSVKDQLIRHVDVIAAGQPLPETAVGLALSPVSTLQGYSSTEFIFNPKFDDGLRSWEFWGDKPEFNYKEKHSGRQSVGFLGIKSKGGVEQILNGLTPGKRYILEAWGRSGRGKGPVIGVKTTEGAYMASKAIDLPYWQKVQIRFTTPSSSKVKIFFYVEPGRTGLCDDFALFEEDFTPTHSF
ncbi:alpha/beta hydrolase [Streptomyces sp. WZ-12]|uniref:alpha/beta hydrolase n=1 Tax=Streptomyces sp. WZ-12 TaxID=3030210 RepID=UPI0023816C65|nr:alpha/beta hydrolase [Streptomyces sp. WZ-12]